MNTFTLGVRNAFRNFVRSSSIILILGLSIGLALTMLIARQTVSQKINSVKSSVGNTITVSPAGFRGFSGTGNPLTSAQMAKVQKLPHVAALSESLTDRLDSSDTNLQSSMNFGALGKRFSENGNSSSTAGGFGGGAGGSFTPPVQVIGTNNPTKLDESEGGGTVKITSGSAFATNSGDNVALVGTSLASKNSLKVGSTFTAYGKTVKVVGIYDAGNSLANGLLIMPLTTIQTLSGQTGDITSATVTVDSLTNVDSVTSSIKSTLGGSADVESSEDATQTTVSSLENIKNISMVSLIGAVVAGAVIILLTMIMIVRERRREIGILKAIGASNSRVIFQFMSEAVTLTLAGAIIGILLGVIGANPITKLLVNSNTSSSSTSQTADSRFGGAGMGGPQAEQDTQVSSLPSSGTNGTERPAGGGGFFGRNTSGIKNSLSSIHANVGWSVLGYGFSAALLIAIVGSSLAGWLIARVKPYEVMRAE